MYNYYNFFESRYIPRHKTFISFCYEDEFYKNRVEEKWNDMLNWFISKSVQDVDISTYLKTDRIRQIIRDNYISDDTVTMVYW